MCQLTHNWCFCSCTEPQQTREHLRWSSSIKASAVSSHFSFGSRKRAETWIGTIYKMSHKTCYLTEISCSAKVLMARVSGNVRDGTVQNCRTLSSKAWQQLLISQLGSTGFLPQDSPGHSLWTSGFSSNHICKYCIFLSHVPLQGKSGMHPWRHNNLTTKTFFKA